MASNAAASAAAAASDCMPAQLDSVLPVGAGALCNSLSGANLCTPLKDCLTSCRPAAAFPPLPALQVGNLLVDLRADSPEPAPSWQRHGAKAPEPAGPAHHDCPGQQQEGQQEGQQVADTWACSARGGAKAPVEEQGGFCLLTARQGYRNACTAASKAAVRDICTAPLSAFCTKTTVLVRHKSKEGLELC